MEKVELLSPVGDQEKLEYALKYGADAVYLGPALFSLRTSKNAFTLKNIPEVVQKVHSVGKRVYLTLNTMPTERLLPKIEEFSAQLRATGIFPDAFILSDPGVLEVLKRNWQDKVEYHLSTQANCINSLSARFWARNGIKRIILGRELTLEDIRQVKENLSGLDLKLEVFIHGAMCMAYSGRCLLSSFFTGRDANRGQCAHPCRWKYHIMEETRPGEYFPIEENETGTYLLNSYDLCVGNDIFKLLDIGIDSLKIEGRNKGTYYVSVVTGAYRKLIDLYYAQKNTADRVNYYLQQLETVTHRPYSKGFFYGQPRQETSFSKYLWKYRFLGFATVQGNSVIKIQVRNQFQKGETIELIDEKLNIYEVEVNKIEREVDGEMRQEEIAKNGWQVEVRYNKNIELPPLQKVIVRKKWNITLN